MWKTMRLPSVISALLLSSCSVANGELSPECQNYLKKKNMANPEALKAALTRCTSDYPTSSKYAPNPKSKIHGVTDTTDLSCEYGHHTFTEKNMCCGIKPHFNWVIATCEEEGESAGKTGQFCRNIPPCVKEQGDRNCGMKINYAATYQFDGKQFHLQDESAGGDVTPAGISGSYSEKTGWEKHKEKFYKGPGDWSSKYAPSGKGPNGPRGGTPPGILYVLSTDNFYYGAWFMLSQLTLNLEKAGLPNQTNCWNWEVDPVEGALGWMPDKMIPGNMNQLYATNSAAVSGCMMIPYSAMQLQGLQHEFTQPEVFKEYCKKNQDAVGCKPWEKNVEWSGGVQGTQRFENYQNQPYVFAMVVERQGYWIYRWIPDAQGKTGWDGIELHSAKRVLSKRPRAVKDPEGLATDVRGHVKEAVILQPSVPPKAACQRASFEDVKLPEFAGAALGAMAHQTGQNKPGKSLQGAQNWWQDFHETGQYQDHYPASIMGRPGEDVKAPNQLYTCNEPGKFGPDCKQPAAPTSLVSTRRWLRSIRKVSVETLTSK